MVFFFGHGMPVLAVGIHHPDVVASFKVAVELVEEGSLAEAANLCREGKPKRLLDRRHLK